ncbi:hypothetical protein Vi05172_g9869 [Venturia inaequalis]|nr:hypothetical protein Vi05172_g9869 [Venturia inaequalis]
MSINLDPATTAIIASPSILKTVPPLECRARAMLSDDLETGNKDHHNVASYRIATCDAQLKVQTPTLAMFVSKSAG